MDNHEPFLPLTTHSFQCLIHRIEDEVNAFNFAIPKNAIEKRAFDIGAREAKALLATATELYDSFILIQSGRSRGGFTDAQLSTLSFLGFDVSSAPLMGSQFSGERHDIRRTHLMTESESIIKPQKEREVQIHIQSAENQIVLPAVKACAVVGGADECVRLREEITRLRGCLLGQGFACSDEHRNSSIQKPSHESSAAQIQVTPPAGNRANTVETTPPPCHLDSHMSPLDLVQMIRQSAAREEELGRRRMEEVRSECTLALQRMRRDFMCAMHLQETKKSTSGSIGTPSTINRSAGWQRETLTTDAFDAQNLLQNEEELATFYATAKAVELWCHLQDGTARGVEYRLTPGNSTAGTLDEAVIALLNRLRLPFPVCIRRLGSGGDYYIDRRVKIKFSQDGDLVVREVSESMLADQPYVLLAQYILHLYSPLLDLQPRNNEPVPFKAKTAEHITAQRDMENQPSRRVVGVSKYQSNPEQSAVNVATATRAAARLEMLLDQHANLSTQIRDQETRRSALQSAAASNATPPRNDRPIPLTSRPQQLSSGISSMALGERWRYPPSPSPSRFMSDAARAMGNFSPGTQLGDVDREYQCPSKSLGASPLSASASRPPHSVAVRQQQENEHQMSLSAPGSAVSASFLQEDSVLSPRVRRVIDTMYNAGSTIPDLSQFTVTELQELREETYRIQRAQQLIASSGTQ